MRGAAWAVSMRWTVRLIGLVSMVILARLLTPDDYGIMAMAMIVTGFSEAIFELGVNIYLIQKTNADDDDFNTGWTLRILQGLCATSLILILIPFAENYYNDARIVEVLPWLSIIPLLNAACNIGIVKFQKELDIYRDFWFFVSKKMIGFFVTICSAFLLRDYWAFVIGGVASAGGGFLLSYVMHPYRPRLSLSQVKPMLSLSMWLLIRNVGAYAQTRMDQIILAGRLPVADLGIYRMAAELSTLPTSEILAPLGRVLLPAFAKINKEIDRLRAAFNKSLGTVLIVGMPLSIGMALVAEPLVGLMLGEKWIGVIVPLQILAIVELVLTLRYVASTVLTSMGHVRFIAITVWLQVILFVAICTGGWFEITMVNVALTRMALGALTTLLVIGQAVIVNAVRINELLAIVARPLAASIVMIIIVLLVQRVELQSDVFALILQTTAGALSYGLSLVLVWHLAGRPDSAERFILEAARLQLRKLF